MGSRRPRSRAPSPGPSSNSLPRAPAEVSNQILPAIDEPDSKCDIGSPPRSTTRMPATPSSSTSEAARRKASKISPETAFEAARDLERRLEARLDRPRPRRATRRAAADRRGHGPRDPPGAPRPTHRQAHDAGRHVRQGHRRGRPPSRRRRHGRRTVTRTHSASRCPTTTPASTSDRLTSDGQVIRIEVKGRIDGSRGLPASPGTKC